MNYFFKKFKNFFAEPTNYVVLLQLTALYYKVRFAFGRVLALKIARYFGKPTDSIFQLDEGE